MVFPDVGIDILVEADDGLAGNSGKTGAEGFGIGKPRVRPVVAACRMICDLATASRLIVAFLMFCGRVGSVSFALALMEKKAGPPIKN
ncbi:MAG: hypothetical protein IJC53_02450, partial [Clostridia bacterium]|nr:hypothetical protein [Clostridia bacterium]